MTACIIMLVTLIPTVTFAQAEYVVAVSEEAPTVDGALNEAFWDLALEPPTFLRMGFSSAPAGNATKALMVAGRKGLYIGLEAESAPNEMPVAEKRPRDGRTYADDSVELFINPGVFEGQWYRFAVNAVGSFADTISDPSLSREQRIGWSPDWDVTAVPREGGWTAEMVIPYTAVGVEKRPHRGHVWRIRMGRIGNKFPNSMWPHNDTTSFHNHRVAAYLIFEDRNLLANGGFEGSLNDDGEPAGWNYSIRPAHGKGKIEVSEKGAQQGQNCIRYEKFDDFQWYPQLHCRPVRPQAGSTYEFSALVNCPVQFVMRWAEYDEEGRHKHSTYQPPTDGWQRSSIELPVKQGMKKLTIGLQLTKRKGVMWIDDVRVVRRNDIKLGPPEPPKPHRYHDLQELASRTRFKPYGLLQREDGSFAADRVIFEDTGTGAEIRLLTRSANGKSTRHFYMEASPWNADHSQVCLYTDQINGGNVFMPADGSHYRVRQDKLSSYIWDRRNPNRIYTYDRTEGETRVLYALNIETGEREALHEFQHRPTLWPISQDNKYILVRDNYKSEETPTGLTTTIWLIATDGSEAISLDAKGQAHQMWFSKRPDHSVEFNYNRYMKKSGAWMVWPDGHLRKVADPHWSHRAHSPDGEWVTASGPARIIRWDGSEVRMIANTGTTHNSWRTSPDWWAASSGRYLVRIAADGREFVQRLGAHNSRMAMSTYWTEAHPQMSADGTKLAYASNMLHDIEFYNLVMMLPGAPREVHAERDGERVTLSWAPPEHHKEIQGYLVYRAKASGAPGRQITADPVTNTTFTTGVDDRGPYYYTVTAIERSGPEGCRSAQVCSDPAWSGEVRLYTEAESAQYQQPANEIFDSRAAGLYGITPGDPEVSNEPAVLTIRAPRAGTYGLGVRAKARAEGDMDVTVNGRQWGHVVLTENDSWQWLPTVGPDGDIVTLDLDAGEHELALTTETGGISIDRICLTTDMNGLPESVGGYDATAPEVPSGVSAEAEGCYAVNLSWGPVAARDLSHYNVYCGAEAQFEVSQKRLIGSPESAQFLDWGLQAGTRYHYRVTSVDRRGNESGVSTAVSATTEALDHRLFAEIDSTWNMREKDEVTLPFTAPADGEFVVWGRLRSLDGERRVRVSLLLDDQKIDGQRLDLDYICKGHGGPMLETTLWDCLRPKQSSPGASMAYSVTAGEHELTIRHTGQGNVEFDRFVITNDLGYEPEGRTSFLIKDSRM